MSKVLTLLVTHPGARLFDGDGALMEELAGPGDLRAELPPKAAVQVLLDHPQLNVSCHEVPRLSPREQREAQGRLAAVQADQEGAQALEVDPLAQGGHVLWLASQPRKVLEPWLEALTEAGARPLIAMPWQRAFLAALPQDRPGALYLLLEPGAGRLLFFQGRSLRFLRAFPLPEPLEPRPLAEELSRLRQFIQLKNRGIALRTLSVLGLPEALGAAMEEVARTLGLELELLAQAPTPFLLDGADRERHHKGALDLLPLAIREARRRRLFRALVWTAAGGLFLLTAGTKFFMAHHEAALAREAARAELARAEREVLAREGEEAARLRFPLLRLRWAENRQVKAAEAMEQLGLRLFQVPEGVTLEKVEVHQLPGGGQRFVLEGSAVTRGGFSMGALAAYFNHLAAHPHLVLEPLREVAVVDRAAAEGRKPERALTRFRLEGTVS